MGSKRLDVLLVEKGLASSRENAKKLIESGRVTVDGKVVTKASRATEDEAEITAQQDKYVSRGALKLEKALEKFAIDPQGKRFMDCGASTGGFTDLLLQNGAEHVWAVDVGTSQLAQKLMEDDRVTSIENTNIRYMDKADWMDGIDGVVIDVSFISVTLILQRLFEILPKSAFYVVLIKPQFEAGREALNKHGIVKDKKAHIGAVEKVLGLVRQYGYGIGGITSSPIKGGDGNVEYLLYFGGECGEKTYLPTLDSLVSDALAK